jgi:ABC-type antimicrobial peptide transport system permease subunit
VGTAARTVAVGIGVGIVLVLLTGRLVATMLYPTSPHDPVVMLVANAAAMLIAIVASASSAWRASRADPTSGLRVE